jgi:hypothetical protein
VPSKPHNRFFQILVALLISAGVIGLLAWRVVPWLAHADSAPAGALAATLGDPVRAEPLVTNPGPSHPVDLPGSMPPPRAARHLTAPAARPNIGISISTIPQDATASLEARPAETCTTPCSLAVLPGSYQIVIRRAGYETEYRQVQVSGAAATLQLPPVTLQVVGGVLMLTSLPAGARIFLNGLDANEVTPAQLRLKPGLHQIMVEKNGVRSGEEVDILPGMTTFVRIPLAR